MLMLGGHGTFEVTLRCLIERQEMEAVVSPWTSKSLKSEVGFSNVFNFFLPYFEYSFISVMALTPIRLHYCYTVIFLNHDVVTLVCHMVAVSSRFLVSSAFKFPSYF